MSKEMTHREAVATIAHLDYSVVDLGMTKEDLHQLVILAYNIVQAQDAMFEKIRDVQLTGSEPQHH